ncbi:MAG: WecB/TagA/CpsF family glycosyltransferase [Verrucomicrobiota bacterium]
MARKFQRILGINFYVGDMPDLLGLCAEGNFIVMPAAPALTNLPQHAEYRESLEKCDFALTDSALMVLLWKVLTGESLPRISGLKLMRGLLAGTQLRRPGSSLWIMPSLVEQEKNLAWLNANGYPVTPEDCLIPPFYQKGPLSDPDLLQWVEERRAPYIIVAIGGGSQERLGLYLRQSLSYRPSIICVGAAIGFITGAGVRIPAWADSLMLGSIYRTLADPKRFLPRYWQALQLPALMFKYRDRSVVA